ncbi:hypothetical protein SDC9_147987 [bioreactor metagenome]|uniref:Uncharacterized protein n=1 Tax=bioreactor metagenome TaxID=1076179 RepID=A0A645EI15_9ZZZZ
MYSALVTTRGKTRHVARDAATERDHAVRPRNVLFGKELQHAGEDIQAFVCFACRENKGTRVKSRFREATQELGQV